MKIESVSYPTAVSYPPSNDGSQYWILHLPDFGAGRRFRVSNATVDNSAGYDSLYLQQPGGGGTYIHEFDGTNQQKVLTQVTLAGTTAMAVGASGSSDFGSFTFVLEIETGVATDVYEPITTTNAPNLYIETAGTAFLVASEYGGGGGSDCFWTDFVRAVEDCDGGDVPPA